jgi:hypothetical protein
MNRNDSPGPDFKQVARAKHGVPVERLADQLNSFDYARALRWAWRTGRLFSRDDRRSMIEDYFPELTEGEQAEVERLASACAARRAA